MNVTRITVGRLYNLGSYEHVRYELTVEIKDGESAATAMKAIEKILAGLSPKTSTHSRDELERSARQIDEMHKLLSDSGPDEFRRIHSHFVGTPEEYIARCEKSQNENLVARLEWESRSERARKMLDDLGGAAQWKDAKLDCEDYDEQ